MKKIISVLITLACTATLAYSQPEKGARTEGLRKYDIGVSESMDSQDMNEKLTRYQDEMASTNRLLVSDIFLSYRSSVAKKAGSIIDIIIDAGLNELTELVRDHRKDWQRTDRKSVV